MQALFAIRSERQSIQQRDGNPLFHRFVGLGVDDPVWDRSTYSKNRDRLLAVDLAPEFLKGIIEHPEVKPLLSNDRFTANGTQTDAWASFKRFVSRASDARPPGDEPSVRWRGEALRHARPIWKTCSRNTRQ